MTACPVITGRMLLDNDVLRELREAGVVHHVDLGGRETGLLVTGHAATGRALVDPALLGEPPQVWAARAGTDGAPDQEQLDEEDLFFLPTELHARLRRMITRQLTHRRVAALSGRIRGEVDLLLDAMPRCEPVDLIEGLARPLPVAVLCELLGIPADGRRYLRDYVYGWISEAGAATGVTKSAGEAMTDYLRTLVVARRAEPGDDLISGMARTDGPDTSVADVLSALRLLLVAGHRPVSRLLAAGVGTLLRRRERWERLVADPGSLDATVEELLRLVTPTPLASRYARAGAAVEGVPVPAGGGVHCALGAANRDPARFDRPDEYDPDRPANPHVSFGLGRKHCLGAPLARAEVRLALAGLAARFPGLALAPAPAAASEHRRLLVVLEPA